MASARSRARRNKRAYKAVQAVVRQGQADSLPTDVVQEFIKRTENQRKRNTSNRVAESKRAESARVAKNAWVRRVESSGHQYIRGDRAQRVSLSREDKMFNRRMRRERAKTASDPHNVVKVVERGVKRRVHVETGRIVHQEMVTRTRYVEYARPESQKHGTGHEVRTGDVVQVGPDASLPGRTPEAEQTDAMRARARRHAREQREYLATSLRRTSSEKVDHTYRHTHTSTCDHDGECAVNMAARDVPDFEQAPHADSQTDMTNVERVKRVTATDVAMSRRRKPYAGGAGVRGWKPETDGNGNLIHAPIQWT